MKPSDKIFQEARDACEAAHDQDAWDNATVKLAYILSATLQHLDEQYELERRRVALWTALALIGPGATAERTNGLLKKAGLDVEVKMNEPFEKAKERIVAEAEKAGLV